MAVTLVCFNCKKELQFKEAKVGLREECLHCGADVHACKNCEFYDPKAYNECRESSADVVREKDRANFCDYFQITTRGAMAEDPAAKLRAAAEAWFKKT